MPADESARPPECEVCTAGVTHETVTAPVHDIQFSVRALESLTVEGLQSEIEIRVGEHHSANRGSDPFPCGDAHGTPGRISTENDARGPCLDPNTALEIVDCIEERVLGRQAVVNGHDSTVQDRCETTTVGVLQVEVTEHPVPTV